MCLFALITDGRKEAEIGENSCEDLAFAPHFAGFPQREISKIFENWFWPLNLHKLRHPKGRNIIYPDQIAIKEIILQIRRVKGYYRYYGNDKTFWTEAFFNSITVLVKLFRSTFESLLTLALVDFYCKIFDLAKVYWWQGGVLPLALKSFLGWNLKYYLDYFLTLLPAVEATSHRINIESDYLVGFTDIVEIPQND